MFKKIKFKFLFATALSFALINSVDLQLPTNNQASWLNISSEAEARSSGGRSRSGSFRRRSSGSSSSRSRSSGSSSQDRSSGSSSRSSGSRSGGSSSSESGSSSRNSSSGSPSRSSGSSIQDGGRDSSIENSRSRSNSGSSGSTNVIVVPGGGFSGGGYRSPGGSFGGTLLMFLVLGLFGLVALIVIANMLRSRTSNHSTRSNSTVAGINKERDNDIVTISKLQVALFAQAKDVQSELSELSSSANTDTEEGLLTLLQESVLVLLRNSENWSHALASSESMHIDEAEQAFNRLSFAERSKFSAETLTNVDGKVKRKEFVAPDDEVASYIVVTLLAGTADDEPLFGEIRSTEELKSALEKLASIRSDYLMTFELLWSPQAEIDSLTYDELLTEYTDMVQLV